MIDTELLTTQAQKLGIEIDHMAADRFEILEQRLIKWNERVNLTAITEPYDIVVKHFVDSLSILAHTDIPLGAGVIDVGCGGGFPGLPILIVRPDLEFTFLDATRKKTAFVRDVLRNIGLPAVVLHDRAETAGRMAAYRARFDVAVTRAVASLSVSAEYCLPFVKTGGTFVAMKGAESEAAVGESAIEKLGGKIENVVSLELPNGDKRHLVISKKVSQTPTKYPRKSKKIDTRPL